MTEPVAVAIRRLPHGEGLELPRYATDGAAGMDVVSAEDVTLAPGARHAVATGLAMAIPPGYEIQVPPRSGLASKHGIGDLLLQEFRPDTKRGGVPHAFVKALIVFEEYGRDTSYGAIAAALEVSKDTAKDYIREARAAVNYALGVDIITDGDYVRLVTADDARERANRVMNVFSQQVMPAIRKLEACTKSLAKSGAPLALTARAQAILAASQIEEAA